MEPSQDDHLASRSEREEDPMVVQLKAQVEHLWRRYEEERWKLFSRSFAPRDEDPPGGHRD